MANQFLDAKTYANTMLKLLKNNLVLGRLVDGSLRNEVTDENGLQIYKKRPPRFIAKSGEALAAQDIVVGEETVSVDQYKNVHLSIGDLENVQSFDDLTRNTAIQEAALTLAHDVDGYLHDQIRKFPSWVGTAGETIKTPQQLNKAHTRLMNQSVPDMNLSAVVTWDDAELIRGDLQNRDMSGVNVEALKKTQIPVISAMNTFATNQLKTIATGTRTNGAVNGASQNVNYRTVKNANLLQQTINIDGLGANATISAGEVFTIAGVESWNNRAGKSNGYLQQFTVVSGATADGTGALAGLVITPSIIVQGTNDGTSTDANTAFATVDAAPADNAVVTFLGSASTTYTQRAAFHKNAISLVSAKLAMPFEGVSSFARDKETGIFIRYWRGSDINTGKHIHRWDMIYGAECMDNRLGTRVFGAA